MRKICVITGTRAEFGLLRPLIELINNDVELQLQLIATGMHLSPEFGYTLDEIIAAGFTVDKKVECLLSSDTSVGISKSIALAVSGFADVLDELQPDLVVVLGDRTEILGAVIATAMANILIAHLYGGETTEGAYDEAIRHSITKFSHLHFTSTEVYRKRVIQLGEHPDTVFNVGAIGLDSIKKIELLDRQAFEKSIDFKLNKRNVLITYHPVTLEKEPPIQTFENILTALDELTDTALIFTHANSDKNGRIINKMIIEYVETHKDKAVAFKSLGQLRYLSALQFVDFVIGNSSSGMTEVPAFHIPTINIGDRQKGRINCESVINSTHTLEDIRKSITFALNKQFREKIQQQEMLYGDGSAAEKILQIIKEHNHISIKKSFYNIDF
ncbi:UDP-N-acetylglucosamine 2-epimerase [Capnocytophaga ochracea]|jgi:UDP-N-acetyl-D-glucosamine 2-epimerase, UDP-hydrolysing|uniref:UDP-N-acetylglucosamine 2-epimerase n=1 Tax=Capnocytophaga TaxID=1016 RepID=UPI0006AE4727|nr:MULTISPECIES: UDP-N-acetylglucosamine 2-epimerase [Capnocytophaga]ALC97462.1 UDP-N-acetylglucosamine 2-epimerase [Capnocytophaga sp. oral taxon 323]MEB3015446.1 UDP-N-acetylglucosamine 2-epimerase [Capnocytophaga ochracea]MEB3035527.1 UDP-N-acetylglucosamine 2-epimerase [Capnocytophaga ochracea]